MSNRGYVLPGFVVVARVVAGEPGLANFLRRLVAGPANSPWDNLNLQELVNQAAADPESAQ